MARFLSRLLLAALTIAAGAAGAVDANLAPGARYSTASPTRNGHHLCERLLDADLSGYYVVTDQKNGHSALIQLRRLGGSAAYTVSTAKLNLAAEGFRELQPERTALGWRIDIAKPDRRVNVLSLEREGEDLAFHFEDTQDPAGETFSGLPIEDPSGVRGDILRPEAWTIHFGGALDADMRFTRVRFDRAFEVAVSQSLKSLLAERLESDGPGKVDYIIFVEMKKPMTMNEACQILGTEFTCALDTEDRDQRYYRFAVPKTVYEFLESVGGWTRHWEITHIDMVPARVLNSSLLSRVLERRRSLTGDTSSRSPVSGLGGGLRESLREPLGGARGPTESWLRSSPASATRPAADKPAEDNAGGAPTEEKPETP